MCFEGKKLMVIGGASQHIKVVKAAKKLGIKVYVADYLENSPAKELADVSLLINVMDVDSLVEVCKKEKIDAAIATSLDACQLPYQKVCERMGYRCFGTSMQYHILTNKNAFKEVCRKYGVDTIPSYSIQDIKDENSVEYPVFVKPADCRGSRGQSICQNQKEALLAIEYAKSFATDGNVVIEKYMGNHQDFTVSYLFYDGNAIVVRTGDRYSGSQGSGLENLCIASCSPSRYSDFYLNKVNNRVVNMLREIGIKNGPVFFQGFIDGDTVRFYDPGLRFAGGEYENILKEATGFDVIDLLVRFSLTGKIMIEEQHGDLYKLNQKRLVQLDPTLLPGIIYKIDGIDKIRSLKYIRSVSQRVEIGDKIERTNDLRQRFGEFCILSDSLQEEVENITKVQNLLKVVDEDGNDLVFEKLNTKLLC